MQISQGRIPMSDDEHVALEQLFAEHDGTSATLTRRDPGESGPLLVELSNGSRFAIADDGATEAI